MQNEKINQLLNADATLGEIADALELTDAELELVSGGGHGRGYGYHRRRRLRKRIVISYFRGYGCCY